MALLHPAHHSKFQEFQIQVTWMNYIYIYRADSRLVDSQWEMALQSNAISHCLGANLESALYILGLCPANEKRSYKVTLSLIGWAQT